MKPHDQNYEGAISYLANQYLGYIRGDEDQPGDIPETANMTVRMPAVEVERLGRAAKFLRTSRNNLVSEIITQGFQEFADRFMDEMNSNDLDNIGQAFKEAVYPESQKDGQS